MPPRRRLLLTLLFLASAAGAVSPSAPATTRLVTSATTAPLAGDLATIFAERGLKLGLSYRGSELAIEALRADSADCALISRPMYGSEAREFRATPLAMDSLLIIVNERSPLQHADSALIRKIFSRELSDWHQISSERSGPIVPVTRRATDGTRTVFDKAFGIGQVVPTGIVELGSNLAAVLYVAADPLAVGYVSADAFDKGRLRGLRIQAISLNGLAPDANACDPASYPLCRPILLVRRADRATPGCTQLESFFAGEAGRALLYKHGFGDRAPR